MDRKLVAWAGAVKSWRRHGTARQRFMPALWLFTDAQRLPDPRGAVARLPRGLCGVVLRHDDDPDRRALALDLARLCRRRRLVLVVAGDTRLALALGAGIHLRAGRWPDAARPRARQVLRTSSAHDGAELTRARRAGADLVFLSPVFATASHPDAAALGVVRWARLARGRRDHIAALGGIGGNTCRRLPARSCRAVGGIGFFA